MSTLRTFVCKLPLLCAAGAAGFALGRADARAPASPPCDSAPFPSSTALDATDYARWYPTVRLLDSEDQDGASLLPTTAYAWTPEGGSWQLLEPPCRTAKCYHPAALLLPDTCGFLPRATSGRSADPSSPAPLADR